MLDQVKDYQVKAFDGVNSGIAKAEELHGVAEAKINDILVQLVEKLGEKGEAIKLDELRARYDEIVAKVFSGSRDLSDRASTFTSDLIGKIEARQAGEVEVEEVAAEVEVTAEAEVEMEVEAPAEEAAPEKASTEV